MQKLTILNSSSPVPAGSRDTFFARPQRKYPKKWPWLRRHHWREGIRLNAHSLLSWNSASAGAPFATRGDLPPVKEDLFNTVAAGKDTPSSGSAKIWVEVLPRLFTQQHLAVRFARGVMAILSHQLAQEKQPQETGGIPGQRHRLGIRHFSRPHCPPQGKPFFAYFLWAWTKSKAPGGGATPRSCS